MNDANLFIAEKLRHRIAAQRNNYLWLKRRDLAIEVVIASCYFLRAKDHGYWEADISRRW